MSIDELIPHRAPMRWIDALTRCTDSEASATTTLDAANFAVEDSNVLEVALVECVAQTVAAAQGRRARASGQPVRGDQPPGMLVAVTNFRIHSRPRAGQTLDIDVRDLKRFGPMLQVAGVICCAGQVIATGELTLYA